MTDRVKTTQDIAQTAFVALLRTQLGLNESQSPELSDPQEVPPLPPGGDYFLTIASTDSDFNEGEQSPEYCNENVPVTVTIYTRVKLDKSGSDVQLLHEARRGLLPIKRLVLKALVGQDLQDPDGNTFLAKLLWCSHAGRVEVITNDKSGQTLGRLTLTFQLSFDWDLTAGV